MAPVVVVDDPGGHRPGGRPGRRGAVRRRDSDAAAAPIQRPPPRPARPPAALSRIAGLGGPLPFDAGTAGLGTLLAISAASLAVTLLRREQSKRRLATRIAGRLATFAAGPEGSAGPPPASATLG